MNAGMTRNWQASFLPAIALCMAVLLHGAFSSPAPKIPGIAEMLIGASLIIAALPRASGFLNADELFRDGLRMAWLWLLLVPLSIALMSGNDLNDTTRDLAAVCFLGVPALIGKIDRQYISRFALVIAAAGAMLALRYWIITDGFAAFRNLKAQDGMLYLPLDPMVLFAAIYFPVFLVENLFARRRVIFKFLISVFCLLAAGLCWGALSGMMMRGALVLGIFSLTLYALHHWRKPVVPVFMGAIAVGVIIMFLDPILHFTENLWQKTQSVGLNARDAEFAAIWNIQAVDPFAFMFGQGWGAVYSSPAVGGNWVNFSHGALSFYFLKTGVIGVAVIIFYLFKILYPLRGIWRAHFGILCAAIPPVILAFTFYTSYKFLGCGALLLLLVSMHAHSDPQPR